MEHRLADAQVDFARTLALAPRDQEIVYFDRATAREDLGDFKGAYADYRDLGIEPGWNRPRLELSRFTVTPSQPLSRAVFRWPTSCTGLTDTLNCEGLKMKFVFLGTLAVSFVGAAQAAEPSYSQVDVISVIPRSPDVKPVTMSVPAEGGKKQPDQADITIDAKTGKIVKIVADADSEKLLPKSAKQ